jgi:hypothetical protein
MGLSSAALLFAITLGGATAQPGKAAWLEHCVDARVQESGTRKMRRAYCRCMQDMTDESELMRITELERKWPPAHQLCYKRAGMRPPR